MDLLRNEAGLDEEVPLGLAAEMFADRKGVDRLIEILRHQFTVKEITDHHLTFGSVPWKRIYKTNYDNVMEAAYAANSRKLVPVTLSEAPVEYSGKDNLCVHINDYIDRLTGTRTEEDIDLNGLLS